MVAPVGVPFQTFFYCPDHLHHGIHCDRLSSLLHILKGVLRGVRLGIISGFWVLRQGVLKAGWVFLLGVCDQ